MNSGELIIWRPVSEEIRLGRFERSLGGVREVNSIALRELIGSEVESGLEIFSFSALYLTVLPSSAN